MFNIFKAVKVGIKSVNQGQETIKINDQEVCFETSQMELLEIERCNNRNEQFSGQVKHQSRSHRNEIEEIGRYRK